MIYPGMMESVYLKILQINRLLVLLGLKSVTVIRINKFLLEQKTLKNGAFDKRYNRPAKN